MKITPEIAITALALLVIAYFWLKRNFGHLLPRRTSRPVKPAVSHATAGIAPERVAQAIAKTPQGAPLALRTWLNYVNNLPDRVCHIACKGRTGSGKTVLITATLQDRQGAIVVCTPKPDDNFGGLPLVTIDDDLSFTSIAQTIQTIDTEVKARWLRTKHDKGYSPEWLTVVLDDYPYLADEIDGLSALVLRVARMGRSMRVRLILLAQESTVKAWGFEGNGSARANFAFISMAENHQATIEIDGKPRTLDTSRVYDLATRANLANRAWVAPDLVSTVSMDSVALQPAELAALSGDSSATLHNTTATTNSIPTPDSGTIATPDDEEAKMIRYLLQSFSKNATARLLGGSTTTAYKRINKATGKADE